MHDTFTAGCQNVFSTAFSEKCQLRRLELIATLRNNCGAFRRVRVIRTILKLSEYVEGEGLGADLRLGSA